MQAIRRISRDASGLRNSVLAEGARRALVWGSSFSSSDGCTDHTCREPETLRRFSTSSSSKEEMNGNNQRDEGSSSSLQEDEEKVREMAVQKGAKDMMGNILPGHVESILGTQFCDITVKDGRSPIRKVIEDWFLFHWQTALTQFLQQFLQTRIESDFDLEDWLEGSKDAFWAVYMYGNTKEYRLLKPMLSDVLYRAMEMVFDEYNARELEYKPRLDDEIEARVCGIQFMSKKEMYKHTAESLKPEMENPDSEIAGKWLVLSVEFKAKCTIDVVEQKTEKVQSTIVDASPKIFKFANGPLPNSLPVRQLESSWWVYAFS